jgi:hypothetical protein
MLIGLSFHQPMLCANATWNRTGRTFASPSVVASEPHAVFITTNDSIYVTSQGFHSVLMWNDGSVNPVRNFSGGLTLPRGLFVTEMNDLYVDNGNTAGHTTRLNSPYGIFVDESFNLYVADWGNHRIQYFRRGERNGKTLVASSVPNTIALYRPIDVMLDGHGYLFIVEYGNHRIVRSGPSGFRCILGCGGSGSAANQFSYPRIMAFDSRGHIYVADTSNHRIQTFNLISNQCRKSFFNIENEHFEETLSDHSHFP